MKIETGPSPYLTGKELQERIRLIASLRDDDCAENLIRWCLAERSISPETAEHVRELRRGKNNSPNETGFEIPRLHVTN